MSRRTGAAGAIGIAAAAIGLLAGAVGTIAAVVTVAMARRVVIPPATQARGRAHPRARPRERRRSCSRASDETRLPGRYGFWFDQRVRPRPARRRRRRGRDRFVRRQARLASTSAASSAPTAAAFSGWYHLGPWELGHAYETSSSRRRSARPGVARSRPATRRRRWVIQVHGRGAKRQEGLRAVARARRRLEHAARVYRNDGEAPESEDRRYGLGATEWRDVDGRRRVRATTAGRERIVLMGWSMGGAIVLQAVLRAAAVRERLVGRHPRVAGRRLGGHPRLPGRSARAAAATRRLAVVRSRRSVERRPHRPGGAITFDGSRLVARADECDMPILILHSDDDGFVPIDGSRRSRRGPARPRRVRGVRGRAPHEAVELRPGALDATSCAAGSSGARSTCTASATRPRSRAERRAQAATRFARPGASRGRACPSCRAMRSGETAAVRPMRLRVVGRARRAPRRRSGPSRPCARMQANPRVVGDSRRRGRVQVHHGRRRRPRRR